MEQQSNRILLSVNDESISEQRDFIENLASQFLDLISAFNNIGIGKLKLSELPLILKGSAEHIIIEKAKSKFKGAEFNGVPIKSEKVLELIDVDTSSFKDKFESILDFAKIHGKNIDLRFFIFEKENISIDEAYFEKWTDTNCKVYTENLTQNEILKNLQKICDGLNEIIAIKPSKVSDDYKFRSTQWFARNPKIILESEFGGMIVWDGTKYAVRNEFILSH